MLKFVEMSDQEFQDFLSRSIGIFAEELKRSGISKDIDAASERSKQTFDRLLPDGKNTSGHYLYHIMNDQVKIGHMWYGPSEDNDKEAFIYDFVIDDQFQGRGFGKQSMVLLEIDAKEKQYKKIALHVFGHNKRAIGLYQKMGFEPYSMHMSKSLD